MAMIHKPSPPTHERSGTRRPFTWPTFRALILFVPVAEFETGISEQRPPHDRPHRTILSHAKQTRCNGLAKMLDARLASEAIASRQRTSALS